MSRVATALVVSATVLNLVVLGLIYWLFRQIRIGHLANLWYRDPLVGSELALSMQLEAIQALLIVIGLGLTGLGVFGFKSIQDGAERAAAVAAERAAEKAAADAVEEVMDTFLDLDDLDDEDDEDWQDPFAPAGE